MSWDLLFQIWQHGQEIEAQRKAEEDARKEREAMEAFISRQEALARAEEEKEKRLLKEEEDRIKKEEEERIKAIENERLSTVWTAQNVLEKFLKDKKK